ncbi:uncharacterized protein C15orf39 homolog [Tachysurus vachellii]|uniref:uncharacterized protein C15orf39 homolog n=1 Tax=Tachysurus vachellii TaxID=175792 RepID=UPI00296AB8FD|nr:uncharacterized protein C15orf39 homolog [Tachysurus vachellii]XP_060733944.1 uncharacterized protein C15orf39 homolog [Tachysurus vachellii]XP_060733945.1 uncharacterized protein C15orf39 homolog [Tachysurus vachellii]
MMNSKQAKSFMDPLPQSKRARLEGTMGTVSKADSLPQYSQDKSLPYRHTYMSCGQETLDLPSPWSPSRIFVRTGGSPVVSATEGSITNPIIYRPENINFPEDKGSPTGSEVVVKQKLAYDTRSLSKQSPNSAGLMSPVPFRKTPLGCTSLSPSPSEKSGGLAIPKPVYAHRPCCAGQKYTVGHSYTMDQGLQRMPRQMFEDDQMTYYGHWECMHKKESEALMQHRLLAYEQCGGKVPLKDVTTEGYHGLSQSKPQSLSAFSNPCHGNYLYNHVHPFVPSSPDHCQRFQMPRQAHKDMAPMYETVPGMQYGTHMQIYQDCPLTSKYRDIPQHSVLYCQKNNISQVYRTENFQQTSGQHPVLQPFFRDFRQHYPLVSPGHPVVRNVAAYPACRTHTNPFSKRAFCPPVLQQVEQPLDFSMRQEKNAESNQEQPLQGQLGVKGTFHQTDSQAHYMVSNKNSPLESPCQGQDNCPLKSQSYTNSSTCTGDIFSKKQSLGFSDKASNVAVVSKKLRVETDKSSENDSLVKLQTTQQLKAYETKPHSSPPMPVINKVFSLAPYKAYLEGTGLLSPAQDPSCPNQLPNSKPQIDEREAQNSDPQTKLDKYVKLKIKTEKIEPDERVCQSEKESQSPVISQNNHNVNVKEEQDNLESTEDDSKHNLVMKTGLCSCSEMSEHPLKCTIACSVMDGVAVQNGDKKQLDFPASLSTKPLIQSKDTFSLNKIPPHCLKLTSFKIVLPELFKTPISPVPEILRTSAENKVAISSRQARYQFMELHQSLCRLVSGCISQTSHCELRNWLSNLDLDESIPLQAKTQKVSCLLGSKAREMWMKDEEIVRALHKVLYQLENYVRIQECPFPHVIRAGAVFIPMLVVKEVLFPHVQGTFIDQVLQEHRVELRPTTLTEERQLTQLHKRAFSSKLRRLLSLKHLPDIYPDVLNLLYYAGVCKFIDSTPTDDAQKK